MTGFGPEQKNDTLTIYGEALYTVLQRGDIYLSLCPSAVAKQLFSILVHCRLPEFGEGG